MDLLAEPRQLRRPAMPCFTFSLRLHIIYYSQRSPISIFRNSQRSFRARSVLASQSDSPRRWRAHCVSAHIGDQHPNSAPFAEVNPNISTASLRHTIAQFAILGAQWIEAWEQLDPLRGGTHFFGKVSWNRAITQCVTPRPCPLWATSTPFVRGIRQGIMRVCYQQNKHHRKCRVALALEDDSHNNQSLYASIFVVLRYSSLAVQGQARQASSP